MDLKNDFSKGINSYPVNLTDAYTRLTTWEPKFETKFAPNVQGTSFAQHASNIACWGCNAEGILLSDCKNPTCVEKWKLKLARNARKDGETEQGQQHLNIDQDLLDTWIEAQDSHAEEYIGYAFHQDAHKKLPKNVVLLDNQSTHHTFFNGNLLENIRKENATIMIEANGGRIKYDMVGEYPGFGTVWYNPEGIANILSMATVEKDGHEVRYENSVFYVTNNNTLEKISFARMENGLYAHLDERGSSFVQTVDENLSLFTNRQVVRAKQARELYEMIGRPSIHDFLGIINNHLLPNNRITARDVMTAEEIFGKDLGAIQGKTTRNKTEPVPSDYVNMPPDILKFHKDVTLAADLMFVNKIPFLITTSRSIQFTTAERLDNRDEETLITGILKVRNLYTRRGFNIHICMMDNEFSVLRDGLLMEPITLTICAPNEHVP